MLYTIDLRCAPSTCAVSLAVPAVTVCVGLHVYWGKRTFGPKECTVQGAGGASVLGRFHSMIMTDLLKTFFMILFLACQFFKFKRLYDYSNKLHQDITLSYG